MDTVGLIAKYEQLIKKLIENRNRDIMNQKRYDAIKCAEKHLKRVKRMYGKSEFYSDSRTQGSWFRVTVGRGNKAYWQ